MLTPEYLARFTDRLLGLYDELDRAIVADIARRIVKAGIVTPAAVHQIDTLQQVGMMTNEITKQVSVVSRLAEDEVRRLFEESAEISVYNDVLPLLLNGQQVDRSLSPAMRQVLQASINKTNSDLRNLTMTTGVTASGKYLEAVNNASMKVQSGAFSYNQAICDAVREAAEDGNTVSYASGHPSKLDVAVRRSVLTGISQTTGKLTEMNAEALGAEYYEVSAHAGARPTHAVWQGKVFKINGSTTEYPNFYESTGYGKIDGLCGVNCRHSFYPFFPGISRPAYTKAELDRLNEAKYTVNGQKLTEYEVSQLMRKSERAIRATKRKIIGYQAAMEAADNPRLKADLQADCEAESMKLHRQQAQYNDLCKQTDHKPDYARTGVAAVKDGSGQIVSWNREVAKESVKGAERSYQRRISGVNAKESQALIPTVVERKDVTVDGVTYSVDGKHVLSDHTEHEKEIAHVLSNSFKTNVELVPRVVFPQKVSTPDYLINGERYELKTVNGSGKNALYDAVRNGKKQADKFVVDVTNMDTTNDEVQRQINTVFRSDHTRFVKQLIIVKDNQIVDVINRKK